MGFLDLFKKKKKQITPQELRDIMNDLRSKYNFVKAIEKEELREPQAKALIAQAGEVYATVQEILKSVEKQLQELSGSGWWATAEARGRDYMGLSKGRESLLSYKAEIENMVKEISSNKKLEENQEEPVGPSN